MTKLELMQAVKRNDLFETMAQDGYTMRKETLLTVIKELEYVVFDLMTKSEKLEVNESLVDALSEIWEEQEDEEA
jgi:hypothetical protein